MGVLAGPLGLKLIEPQLSEDGALIQSLSEAVLLICLFCAGLRLRAPLDWAPWRAPLQLASLTTVSAALLSAGAAYLIFGMSLLQALLLAVILAPTDAVLASDAHAGRGRTGAGAIRARGRGRPHQRDRGAGRGIGADADGRDARPVRRVLGSLTLTVLWSLAGGGGSSAG